MKVKIIYDPAEEELLDKLRSVHDEYFNYLVDSKAPHSLAVKSARRSGKIAELRKAIERLENSMIPIDVLVEE